MVCCCQAFVMLKYQTVEFVWAMSGDGAAIVIGVFFAVIALFVGVVLIIGLAPSVGQIGGTWDETLFVLFAGFMVIAAIVAFLLGKR